MLRELCPNPHVTRNAYGEGVDHTDQVLVHAYDHVEMRLTARRRDGEQTSGCSELLCVRAPGLRLSNCLLCG